MYTYTQCYLCTDTVRTMYNVLWAEPRDCPLTYSTCMGYSPCTKVMLYGRNERSEVRKYFRTTCTRTYGTNEVRKYFRTLFRTTCTRRATTCTFEDTFVSLWLQHILPELIEYFRTKVLSYESTKVLSYESTFVQRTSVPEVLPYFRTTSCPPGYPVLRVNQVTCESLAPGDQNRKVRTWGVLLFQF